MLKKKGKRGLSAIPWAIFLQILRHNGNDQDQGLFFSLSGNRRRINGHYSPSGRDIGFSHTLASDLSQERTGRK
jgi:hypothetical protein